MTETELKYNRDLCAPSRSALTRSACTGTARVPRVHPGAFPGERYLREGYDPRLARFRGLCAPELRALPALERFLFHGCEREGKSADTIVPEPGSIKAYDRYAHVNGNPVKYNDPSGHRYCDTADGACTGGGGYGAISVRQMKEKDNSQKSSNEIYITITKSFSLQPIGINRKGESYTGFSGSGDPNTIFRPSWDNRTRASNQTNPSDALDAIAYSTEAIGNANYVLFPNGNQIVTSQIQTHKTDRLAYLPLLKLSDLLITNKSETFLNNDLFITGSTGNYSSTTSALPGKTASFNIPPISIPSTGLVISVWASNNCKIPCITSQNRVIYRGWIDFSIR